MILRQAQDKRTFARLSSHHPLVLSVSESNTGRSPNHARTTAGQGAP